MLNTSESARKAVRDATAILEHSAVGAEEIDFEDSVSDYTLRAPSRAIWVGDGGNLGVVMLSGDSVVLVGALTGSLLPISVTAIVQGTTTAADLVAIY
jgi:hypothetical protein